ncbi:MAG: hypothetical protein GY928_35345 [Colwellia sp.]|nr:hypothetical protein [Colwellia sp.]
MPEYEANPSNYNLNSITKEGLFVAIKPLTDKTEIKKYFGTDLLSKNILPVFVIAENNTTSSSFILFKDKISLRQKDASLAGDSDYTEARNPEDTAVAVAGGISFFVPAVQIVALPFLTPLIAQSNEIEHNILSKELQTKTLSPGKKIQGFAYFQIPSNDINLEQFSVHIEALVTKSKETIDCDFQL